jgi:hypothetical protein
MQINMPAYTEMPEDVCRRAREILRKEINESSRWKIDDLHADCIIEQVWNALVGHDPAGEDSTWNLERAA